MPLRTFLVTTLILASPFLVGHTLYAAGANTVNPTSGADTVNPSNSSGGLQNPLNVNSLPELLNNILDGLIVIGSILLTLMVVYVGFLFVAARGNEEKISSARQALIWTIVGGLILLGARAISDVIQSTVGTITS